MLDYAVSQHANIRIQQRSFPRLGLDAMLSYGTYVKEDHLILTHRDIQEKIDENKAEFLELSAASITPEISERLLFLKAENERLKKLHNRKLIVRNNVVVTAYTMTKRQQRTISISLRYAY